MGKRLWGEGDCLTPEGQELGSRACRALSGLIEEYVEQGYSLRDIFTVIFQELGFCLAYLLDQKGRG